LNFTSPYLEAPILSFNNAIRASMIKEFPTATKPKGCQLDRTERPTYKLAFQVKEELDV